MEDHTASNVLRDKETAIEPYLNEKLEDPADTVGNTFINVVGNNIRVIVGVPVTEQPVTGRIGSLTTGISRLQLQDQRLWIRYNDERVSLPENILDLEESKLVTELFNTEDNAYEITVEGNDNEGEEKEYGSNIENIETNRIEDAFQIGYQGTVLETFYSRLKQFHNEWHKQINHMPLT
ncbi:unnamed protein product [Rhizophagus irregularis]|nr:unnamed protein product [Rhizophagus irregularis]